MSKFSLAMPLVVRDLQTDKYLLMQPFYKDVIIKWEANEGKITENYLFQSPFKLVICVRTGDNGKRSGKSEILNQITKKECVYSSRAEPGGKHGKPLTVDGSVEFIWLTEETCCEALWTELLKEHYASETDELILLANLHGDINDFADFLDVFEAFSPTYLIFVMPTASVNSKIFNHVALQSAVRIYVDPDDTNIHEQFTIEISTLCDYDTRRTLTEALALAIEKTVTRKETDVDEFFKKSESKRLEQAEKIYTDESQAVIEFVKEHKCKASKQLLKTSDLMNKFQKIFSLSSHEIRKAISHLETELSSQASIESLAARESVQKLRKKRLTLFGSEAENRKEIEAIEFDINNALAEVDKINFGLEHFFREACSIFQNNILTDPSNTHFELPSYCADLLSNGNAIELLNGDDQDLSIDWLTAICDRISKKQPEMKVFVVSIIGLQSSGKSTLLNALFSCKFTVSVGRCSRGLFVRLAFLNEQLRNEFGFDAFLLIDTEGMGSPEKINDINAAQKDRKMATLAMGISNLTIINVMGETTNEMTEILQIAIVAMSRLEKTDMASDILLVQHLQEKNELRSSGGKDSFCKALKEAFDLTKDHSTVIGALDVECLSNLIRRIKAENFLKQFSPLKDGCTVYAPLAEGYHKDIVDLYNTILTVSKKVASKHTLLNWSKLVGSYWTCAKEEKFASRFKNAKELIEFLDHEEKLEAIRNAVVHAYISHCTHFENQMRQQINRNDYEKNAFLSQTEDGLTYLPRRCSVVSTNGVTCDRCNIASILIDRLKHEVAKTDKEQKTANVISSYLVSVQNNFREKLSNMFDAMVIEDKFCDKYGETINIELRLLLKSRQSVNLTEKQRQEEVARIWTKLEKLSTEGKVDEPVQTRIENEIQCAYENNEKIMEIYRQQVLDNKLIERGSLNNGVNENQLSEINIHKLLNVLRNLVQDLLHDDKHIKGFEPIMIYKLKTDIDKAMKHLESEFHHKFNINYRWMAHAYTLQQFAKDMEQKQNEWDLKHNPRVILRNKKNQYINVIDTRLQLGFTAAGDGCIVAETFFRAMHKHARAKVEQQLIEDFVKQEWAKHAESVRLKYFEGLAKEVNIGQKMRAVEHFVDPTTQIERWFTKMADTYDKEQMDMKYVEHLKESKSSILSVLAQGVLEKAVKYLNDYIDKTDEKYYLKRRNYTNEEKTYFMATLEKAVEEFKCDIDEHKDKILPPSKNDQVRNLLGCTECCPICHALCWMSRGHAGRNSTDKMATLHRTCHQPVGLGGTHNSTTKELRCRACHSYADTDPFTHNGIYGKWSDAKKHSPNWAFENYHNVKFQELMNWFMAELHADIAVRVGYKPALPEELKENNCASLKINEILTTIHVRLLE